MLSVFVAVSLAAIVYANPVADLNTPQQIQELVERLVKIPNFTPEQERQVLDAVADELKDPETLKLLPTISAMRSKHLRAYLTQSFSNTRRDPEFHTPLFMQGFARGTAMEIRAFVHIPAGKTPSAKAVEQMQILRRIFEERLAELYPGIQKLENWGEVKRQLEVVMYDQESDFNARYKTELPSEQFEALAAELRQIPEIGVIRRRRPFNMRDKPPVAQPARRPVEPTAQTAPANPRGTSGAGSTRGRDSQPPAQGESWLAPSNPFTNRIPWPEADEYSRNMWLRSLGRVELAFQFRRPVSGAFSKVSPDRQPDALVAYFHAHSAESGSGPSVEEEQNEIEKRRMEDSREKIQRDWERTVNRSVAIRPSPPRTEPIAEPALQPPPRGRLAWVLAVNGVAGAALVALYLRGRFRRK